MAGGFLSPLCEAGRPGTRVGPSPRRPERCVECLRGHRVLAASRPRRPSDVGAALTPCLGGAGQSPLVAPAWSRRQAPATADARPPAVAARTRCRHRAPPHLLSLPRALASGTRACLLPGPGSQGRRGRGSPKAAARSGSRVANLAGGSGRPQFAPWSGLEGV